MGIPPRGSLTLAVHRALASVAVFAQVMLVVAPLVEVHHEDRGHTALVMAARSQGGASWVSSHGPITPHNATTCPACIAQTMHAQVTRGFRLPTMAAVERAPADQRSALIPHHDPPATHQSRAPPAAS